MTGLITKTNRLWLPLLAMLVSATVSSRFVQPHTLLTGQTAEEHFQHVLSAVGLESCCQDQYLNVTTPLVNQLPPEQAAGDAMEVADIWVRLRSGLVFPAVDPDTVRTCIDEYTKHPYLTAQLLQRGKPYLFHILNRLEQAGMPAELALLPVIESAFDPFATSPAGAAGIWQFMPRTAADVGLEQDWWYDGRRDILASTRAALDYLGQLNKRFDGDWLLTLAAYNAGSAKVQRAIRHNRDAGKPVDFWHLPLPAETRSYVPRLIALRMIIENPADYNITLPTLLDTRYFSTLKIRGQIELRVVAQLAGVPLAELERLNPGYDRSITPPDETHTLLVPEAVAQVLHERIARLPQEQRIQSVQHRIRRGDNLSTIALRYRTTVPVLRKVNRLQGNRIIAGNLLIVPVGEQDIPVAGNIYAARM